MNKIHTKKGMPVISQQVTIATMATASQDKKAQMWGGGNAHLGKKKSIHEYFYTNRF